MLDKGRHNPQCRFIMLNLQPVETIESYGVVFLDLVDNLLRSVPLIDI